VPSWLHPLKGAGSQPNGPTRHEQDGWPLQPCGIGTQVGLPGGITAPPAPPVPEVPAPAEIPKSTQSSLSRHVLLPQLMPHPPAVGGSHFHAAAGGFVAWHWQCPRLPLVSQYSQVVSPLGRLHPIPGSQWLDPQWSSVPPLQLQTPVAEHVQLR
jgi:hypothetical protein